MRISVGMRLTNVVLHLSPELMRLEIWGKSKINFKTMFIKEILLWICYANKDFLFPLQNYYHSTRFENGISWWESGSA